MNIQFKIAFFFAIFFSISTSALRPRGLEDSDNYGVFQRPTDTGESALVRAAQDGDLNAIRNLLKFASQNPQQAPSILAPYNGNFAINKAIIRGNLPALRLLLLFAIENPNWARQIVGRSALFNAAYSNQGEALTTLVNVALAQPTLTYLILSRARRSGMTALHYAAQSGSVMSTQRLLDVARSNLHFANLILSPMLNGLTAAFLAAEYGRAQVLRVLLESPFRDRFLNDNHVTQWLGNDSQEGKASLLTFRAAQKVRATYRILLEFAPRFQRLAGVNARVAELRIGNVEHAIFFRDLWMVSGFLENEEIFNPKLLIKMLENAPSLNAEEYMIFVQELEMLKKANSPTLSAMDQLGSIIDTLLDYFLEEPIAKRTRRCHTSGDEQAN